MKEEKPASEDATKAARLIVETANSMPISEELQTRYRRWCAEVHDLHGGRRR